MTAGDVWRWTDEHGVQRQVGTAELRAALASSVLPASTLVWRAGMKEWAPASTMPELAGAAFAAKTNGASPDDDPAFDARGTLRESARRATLIGLAAPVSDQPASSGTASGRPVAVPAPGERHGRLAVTQVPPFGAPVAERPQRVAPAEPLEPKPKRKVATSEIDSAWVTTARTEEDDTIPRRARPSELAAAAAAAAEAAAALRDTRTRPRPEASPSPDRKRRDTSHATPAPKPVMLSPLGPGERMAVVPPKPPAPARKPPPLPPRRTPSTPPAPLKPTVPAPVRLKPPSPRADGSTLTGSKPSSELSRTMVSPGTPGAEPPAQAEPPTARSPVVDAGASAPRKRPVVSDDETTDVLVKPTTAEAAPTPGPLRVAPPVALDKAAPDVSAVPQGLQPAVDPAALTPPPAEVTRPLPAQFVVPSLGQEPLPLPPPRLPIPAQPRAPREEPRPTPRSLHQQVPVPISSLLGGGAVLIGMVIAAFFVGRASSPPVPLLAARPSLAAIPLIARAAIPPDPKPCWMVKQPAAWAPKVSKSIPFEVVAAKANTVAVGYARDANTAVGIVVDVTSGEVQRPFEDNGADDIERVVPTPAGEIMVSRSGSGALLLAIGVPATPPFSVGVSGGAIGIAPHPDGAAAPLWQLEGDDSLGAASVRSAGAGVYVFAFRRAGAIWGGLIGADRQAVGGLVKVAGSGGAVGKPEAGWNGREVAMIFGDRPEAEGLYEIRIGHAAGQVPSTTAVLPLPKGGPGGDAFSPAIAGLPDGRWLLMWTEGSAGSRAVRAQTLTADFEALGDPIALSPPAGNFGQGAIGVTGSYAATVFLSKGASSYELWGAVLQCM